MSHGNETATPAATYRGPAWGTLIRLATVVGIGWVFFMLLTGLPTPAEAATSGPAVTERGPRASAPGPPGHVLGQVDRAARSVHERHAARPVAPRALSSTTRSVVRTVARAATTVTTTTTTHRGTTPPSSAPAPGPELSAPPRAEVAPTRHHHASHQVPHEADRAKPHPAQRHDAPAAAVAGAVRATRATLTSLGGIADVTEVVRAQRPQTGLALVDATTGGLLAGTASLADHLTQGLPLVVEDALGLVVPLVVPPAPPVADPVTPGSATVPAAVAAVEAERAAVHRRTPGTGLPTVSSATPAGAGAARPAQVQPPSAYTPDGQGAGGTGHRQPTRTPALPAAPGLPAPSGAHDAPASAAGVVPDTPATRWATIRTDRRSVTQELVGRSADGPDAFPD